MEHSSRRLAVLDEHGLDARVLTHRLGYTLGRHSLAVGRFQLDDAERVGLADREPPLREGAGVNHDHQVAG